MEDVVLLVVDGSLVVEVVEEVVLELVVGSNVVEVVKDVVLELVVGSEVVDVELLVATEIIIVCIMKVNSEMKCVIKLNKLYSSFTLQIQYLIASIWYYQAREIFPRIITLI